MWPFRSIKFQRQIRKFIKWCNSNRTFDSLAVLVLAEEWKEGLQSHEGRIQLNVQKDSNGIEK